LSKQYTRRRNRARKRKLARAKLRRDKLEFYGTCSNCRKGPQLVRRIAGCQVCFACAKKLPGHLLSKVFPVVRDPKLTEFLRDHQVVSTTAVDQPGESGLAPPERTKKSWRERAVEKLRAVCRRLLRKCWPAK
jgi:hypothetical protein